MVKANKSVDGLGTREETLVGHRIRIESGRGVEKDNILEDIQKWPLGLIESSTIHFIGK